MVCCLEKRATARVCFIDSHCIRNLLQSESKSQDSAACVSLSKYSIVKEPDKRERYHAIKKKLIMS